RITASAEAGHHIAQAGSDCRAGQLVLEGLQRIGAAQVACAATIGAVDVAVFERPMVSIVVTGDEVVPLGQPRRPEQIFDSNGPCLAALAAMAGAEVNNLGVCPDDRDMLRARLSEALGSPVVVVVGGMSMGTRDLVPDGAASLGVTWKVHGV